MGRSGAIAIGNPVLAGLNEEIKEEEEMFTEKELKEALEEFEKTYNYKISDQLRDKESGLYWNFIDFIFGNEEKRQEAKDLMI